MQGKKFVGKKCAIVFKSAIIIQEEGVDKPYTSQGPYNLQIIEEWDKDGLMLKSGKNSVFVPWSNIAGITPMEPLGE